MREAKPELPTRTVDEDDATRELQISDRMPPKEEPHPPTPAQSGDEWPTESVSHVTDVGEFTDRMHRSDVIAAEAAAVASATVTVAMPLAQAARVAVSRNAEGVVVVRPRDDAGLRDGEIDAMLVSLDPDTDLREMFK